MRIHRLLILPIIALLLLGLSCSAGKATPTQQPTPTPRVAPTPQAGPQATPAGDTTPPAFGYVKIEGGFWGVPFILWKTNEPTTGRIEYGSDQFEFSSPWSEGLTTSNGVSMPGEGAGLEIMNNYYLRLRVKDAAGNETVSPEMVIPYQEMMDTEYRF